MNHDEKEEATMKSYPIGTGLLLSLTIAVLLGQGTIAATQEDAKMTEAEAKMFSMSAEYERFMGRWSRLLAQGYIAFAGVKNGDRVLDVGTGTGSLAAAIETTMISGEIVGIDPSE